MCCCWMRSNRWIGCHRIWPTSGSGSGATLVELLRQAQEADQGRRREGIDPEKNPAQIPRTDPDSRVLPNKEGGYAPNYTPVTAVDVQGGFIVSTGMLAHTAEQTAVVPLLEDMHETFGEYPQGILGDGMYATGETLVALDSRGRGNLFSPLPGPDIEAENPAEREDPRRSRYRLRNADTFRSTRKLNASTNGHSSTMSKRTGTTVRMVGRWIMRRRRAKRVGVSG